MPDQLIICLHYILIVNNVEAAYHTFALLSDCEMSCQTNLSLCVLLSITLRLCIVASNQVIIYFCMGLWSSVMSNQLPVYLCLDCEI